MWFILKFTYNNKRDKVGPVPMVPHRIVRLKGKTESILVIFQNQKYLLQDIFFCCPHVIFRYCKDVGSQMFGQIGCAANTCGIFHL